ncbi:hypothetical protein STENM223S_08492 [Streptomyces tendae]
MLPTFVGPARRPDAYRGAMDPEGLTRLDRRIAGCRACPRLVAWREEVARTKRAAFADWTYWGRPVPGFGPPDARLLIIGLAPAAHGGNRTGRIFTGDRSGDVLYQALYDVGLASRFGLRARRRRAGAVRGRVTAPVHCAPPANKPTPRRAGRLSALAGAGAAAAAAGRSGRRSSSGRSAGRRRCPAFAEAGWTVPRPRPVFGHGARGRAGRRRRPAARRLRLLPRRASATPSPASSPPRCSATSCARRQWRPD